MRFWALGSLVIVSLVLFSRTADAYPPGVGITAKKKTCIECHVSNGKWDDKGTIIDVIDATTKKSLLDPADGTFKIDVQRNQPRTVLTVLGRAKGDKVAPPTKNAWIYVDPSTIDTSSLGKFAPGWDVNLSLSCRVVGDKHDNYPGAGGLTVLPMTLRPTDSARNADLELQVMLTTGSSVKGDAKKGLVGNYFMKKVSLKVVDPAPAPAP